MPGLLDEQPGHPRRLLKGPTLIEPTQGVHTGAAAFQTASWPDMLSFAWVRFHDPILPDA